MIYDIVMYGNPVLREKAARISEVDDEIRRLAVDMIDTMRAYHGIGLAAEQIGRTESICVVDISPDEASQREMPALPDSVPMPLVLINPVIVGAEGEETGQEGCLSFPEIFVDINRPERISVNYVDLDNRPASLEADGLLARAIQHEVDHLNGKLIVDRMSPAKKVASSGKLKRMHRQGRKGAVVAR